MDPAFKALAEAPPLPEETPPPAATWMRELVAELNLHSGDPLSEDDREQLEPRVPPEHQPIQARATEYRHRTFQWLTDTRATSEGAVKGPREVVAWFHSLIAVKVHRALATWPDRNGEEDEVDNDGSAKIALLAIDESHAAWLELVARGTITRQEADPFIADLVRLGEELEQARPRARAFTRPAFDEPEAVATFLATGNV